MMMDARPATEDDAMISALHEASIQGRVSTLDQLMQNDRLILNKFSLTTISETPLHISASLGHVDFIKTLLNYKPTLASGLDSLGRTPLHLASAEGHTEIVKELLGKNAGACLVRDQAGRIPLHYAAMRGRAEAVGELIKVKPGSEKVLDRGETFFHLCIKYSQLKTLQVLVEFVGDNDEILRKRDCNSGSTILHLAAMLKQTENIKYLLSLPGIKEAANTENQMGFTALDILEHSPIDFESLECRCMLIEAGIKSKKNVSANHVAVADKVRRPKKKLWKKCLNHMNGWFKHEDNWLENTRGNLMIVATVISSMSYQAVIQPPESVRKGETSGLDFMTFNTISFVASLSVILLLLSGTPLRNKFAMWLLSLVMLVNVIVLALAYVSGATAALPQSAGDQIIIDSGLSLSLFGLLLLVSILFLTVRLLVWIGKILYRLIKRLIKCMLPKSSEDVKTSLIDPTQATTPESSV